jgi:hypothetical protein
VNELKKTNIAGFVKDPKQNLLIPVDLEQRLAQMKLNRKQHKKQKAAELIIAGFEAKLAELASRVSALEGRTRNLE